MEPQFKSSFIPKKPVAPVSLRQTRASPLGLLFGMGLVIFVASIAMAGGLFGYNTYLKGLIEEKSKALEVAHRDLEPAIIEEIKRVDARMSHAKRLLQNHLALSPVFTLLQKTTLSSVQYTSFSYTFKPEGGVSLELSGIAPSFGALALQSDELYRNEKFGNVEFASIALDEAGSVIFDLNFDVDSAVASYKNLIESSQVMVETLPSVPVSTTSSATSTASSTQP